MNDWQPILTLIVAASALGVSWAYNRAQVRIARAKLKLDLFERRLAIYQTVTDYMDRQFKPEAVGVDTTFFFQSIASVKWLLDDSVERWLRDELMPEVNKMWTAHTDVVVAPNRTEETRLMMVRAKVAAQFQNQYGRRDEVFGPFLKLHAI